MSTSIDKSETVDDRRVRKTQRDVGVGNELYAQGYQVGGHVPNIQIVSTRMPLGDETPYAGNRHFRVDTKDCIVAGRVITALEFVEMFDGIVPGLSVTYSEPAPEPEPHPDVEWVKAARQAELTKAILLLQSNGYDVAKQPDHGKEYVEGLLAFADHFDTTQHAEILPSQGAHHLVDVLQKAADFGGRSQLKDVEVYVEIDRALLVDTIMKAAQVGLDAMVGTELWTHLWPVVARIDEQNDVVLHVTSGERAQFGKGED